MKNLKVIYTLEVQDGENRYNIHSPQKVETEEGKNQKDQINEFGEELAKEFFCDTENEPIGEWYEIQGGIRAVRYKSFEIVESDKVFELFERVLYK